MTPQALRQVAVDAEKRGDSLQCATSTMLRLLDVAEAAREMRDARRHYMLVSADIHEG